MIWIPWSQFTWSANAVAGNARPVRVLFLIGTVASVPMAASITTAFDGGGPSFAIPLGIILSLGLFTMLFGLPPGHEVRASIVRYSVPNLVAVAIMIVGAYVDGGWRVAVWVLSMGTVLVGMLTAGRREWLVRPGHFAERHGLIVIVALGEVIVALGIALVAELEDGGIAGRSLTATIAAGSFACLLWWGYFDRVNRALEHRHGEMTDGRSAGRYARDVYTLMHLPIVAGIVLVAAALEEIALHPDDVLADAFVWMFVGGMAAFFGGVASAIWRAYGVIARERLLAGVALIAFVLLTGTSIDALVLLVVVDVALLGALVLEHARIEARPRRAATVTPAEVARPDA
jgi:low temperature requirement protein LtrA